VSQRAGRDPRPRRHAGVDDLGAGYSNLSYISELAPAIVKLDRELVTGVREGSRQFRLLGSITRAVPRDERARGRRRSGDGAGARRGAARGADFCQGYYLARPGFRCRASIPRASTCRTETDTAVQPARRWNALARRPTLAVQPKRRDADVEDPEPANAAAAEQLPAGMDPAVDASSSSEAAARTLAARSDSIDELSETAPSR
jgi:EAL domain-containing protein (putative c-di-GMP-specific phosphodiesterase class I)